MDARNVTNARGIATATRVYQNFAILGANYSRGPGNTFDATLAGPEPFRSPAAPFGAWIGVQYRLAGAKDGADWLATGLRS
ncbi:MAG TPA: hypothetical protein VII35_16675 [Steroidobacteraceae bacterium]